MHFGANRVDHGFVSSGFSSSTREDSLVVAPHLLRMALADESDVATSTPTCTSGQKNVKRKHRHPEECLECLLFSSNRLCLLLFWFHLREKNPSGFPGSLASPWVVLRRIFCGHHWAVPLMHQRFWREICGWNFRWVNPGIAKMISLTQMYLPFFQESQKGCEVSANLSSAVWKAMDLDCFHSKCLTSKKGIIWNAELPDMAPFDWEIENDHTKLPMVLMTTKGVGPFWANGCQWTFFYLYQNRWVFLGTSLAISLPLAVLQHLAAYFGYQV